MKKTALFITAMLISIVSFAQTSLQDVVYLKDGSIIRGDIVEYTPTDTVKIMTTDGSVFVYDFAQVEKFAKEEAKHYQRPAVDKKSPWVSGIMSYFVPGMGQMYNGESRKGWIDFSTQIGAYAATISGVALVMEYSGYDNIYYGVDGSIIHEYDEGNRFLSATGLVLFTAGVITLHANWIHSICDAVKSSKRINAENGYVMYQFNDRCAFGMQPSVAYERPQYLQGSKPELSAGMSFKLTF